MKALSAAIVLATAVLVGCSASPTEPTAIAPASVSLTCNTTTNNSNNPPVTAGGCGSNTNNGSTGNNSNNPPTTSGN